MVSAFFQTGQTRASRPAVFQEMQYLPRSRKGAAARCCSLEALGRAWKERLWYVAPLLLGIAQVTASFAFLKCVGIGVLKALLTKLMRLTGAGVLVWSGAVEDR